jgi:hypothetical protein
MAYGFQHFPRHLRMINNVTCIAIKRQSSARFIGLIAAACLATAPAVAATSGKARPLGTFKDWTAATVEQSGKTVCYAFTQVRVTGHVPSDDDESAFAISHTGNAQDAVSIGLDTNRLKDNDRVTVRVGRTEFSFFMDDGNAFSIDADQVIAAFRRGAAAFVSGADKDVGEWTFSLDGFSAAYRAEKKECGS